MYLIYNILLYLLAPLLILYFTIKEWSKENLIFLERLGFYAKKRLRLTTAGPRIWIHAASVGEVNTIIRFLQLLRNDYPGAWIGISTMTLSGLEMARINLPGANTHFLAPFDLFFAVRRAMKKIRPHLYITVETEIWPNHIRMAKKIGARVLMINGRISERTANTYKAFRCFFQKVLACYDLFSMIRTEDAERIKAFGADPKKVFINGNLKFDRFSSTVKEDFCAGIKNLFCGDEKILVAGSTRKGEEELLLQAFEKVKSQFSDVYLIIAPREIHRAEEIGKLVKKFGYTPLLRKNISPGTVITPDTIIILNTIGELFHLYSLATLAFCGGSLVPLGGQNPLEPAFWGKVVLYGHSMEDFLDAKNLLEEVGAGVQVNNAEELVATIITLLQDEAALLRRGETGRNALQKQQGSSKRTFALVKEQLFKEPIGKSLTVGDKKKFHAQTLF